MALLFVLLFLLLFLLTVPTVVVIVSSSASAMESPEVTWLTPSGLVITMLVTVERIQLYSCIT